MTTTNIQERIITALEEKAMKFCIMGTETCTVTLDVTEEEKGEFLDLEEFEKDCYFYEFDGNQLVVSYTEEKGDINDVVEVIKNITYDAEDIDERQLGFDIVAAFGNYSYKGVDSVIVSENQAYIDHEDAPIIRFELEDGKVNAWLV